jgi:hypothetical protein
MMDSGKYKEDAILEDGILFRHIQNDVFIARSLLLWTACYPFLL